MFYRVVTGFQRAEKAADALAARFE